MDMPTPAELIAEAADLEARATKKEKMAAHTGCSDSGRDALLKDAAIFREEAASKRAKAARLSEPEPKGEFNALTHFLGEIENLP